MVAIRTLLARVRKLEVERMNPMLAKFGGPDGWAAFEADAQAGVAEARYDRRDIPAVIASLRRWFGHSVDASPSAIR